MADAEIYVDGIASMQVQNLNALVDIVRAEIIKKYNPADNDHDMHTLTASHINETEYFTVRIHEDTNKLFADIKEKHKHDSTSGSVTPLVDEMIKNFEEISAVPSSAEEKQAKLYCRQLGIDYEKLPQVEFRTLIGILKKSKYLKSKIKQRGYLYYPSC